MELFKAISNSIKDIDAKGRTIVAYASIFGNIDSDDDIIQNGAYTKTIRENGPTVKNRVWHLFNHDTEYPITKPYEIAEDMKGVLFSSKFPDTTFANDLLKLYEAGHLTEHSVWIRIMKSLDEVRQGKTIRLISEVALMEVSSVLWGANEQAQTVAVKSIAELNNRIETGSRIMRNGTLSDEGFKRLENELIELNFIYS
jgi:HK97 family phage prohead protease